MAEMGNSGQTAHCTYNFHTTRANKSCHYRFIVIVMWCMKNVIRLFRTKLYLWEYEGIFIICSSKDIIIFFFFVVQFTIYATNVIKNVASY